ncbi:MAG: hypothetical protein NTV63_00415 [Candidatus Woesearchaeota archaeon]|nr:hypothetical protein [Candidatus Woesearchaeota archaeon]
MPDEPEIDEKSQIMQMFELRGITGETLDEQIEKYGHIELIARITRGNKEAADKKLFEKSELIARNFGKPETANLSDYQSELEKKVYDTGIKELSFDGYLDIDGMARSLYVFETDKIKIGLFLTKFENGTEMSYVEISKKTCNFGKVVCAISRSVESNYQKNRKIKITLDNKEVLEYHPGEWESEIEKIYCSLKN